MEPQSFQSLGNGIYYYNYNITKEDNPLYGDSSLEREVSSYRYVFTQVRIKGEPTVSKCVEAIYAVAKDDLGFSPTNDEDIIYQVKSDFGLVPKKTELDKYKDTLIEEVNAYDKSEKVNSFYFKGEQAWFDKATRVGLVNSTRTFKDKDEPNITLWVNNKAYNLSCDYVLDLLDKLEVYAVNCNNVTNQHKANILALTSIQDYNYKTDYPNKLKFE